MGNGNSKPSLPVTHHSSVLIGDDVFIWGGNRSGIPLVHVNPQKRQFTSTITVYSILQSSLDAVQTTGISPNGTIGYSSCCIGEDIYYFGGSCMGDECYHKDLLVLNTKSHKWRKIDCDNGPMKKYGCGMIHFHINGEDYLLVIGGYGPIAPVPARGYMYTQDPNKHSRCLTNEVYIMCISSAPGKWEVPTMTGSALPSLDWFSINTLPGNRAIIFGGSSIVNNRFSRTNDVIILTYSAINNELNVQRLVKPLHPTIQWPVGRAHSSSAVITSVSSNGVKKHHLFVMGGKDSNNDVLSDAWILSIDDMEWTKIALEDISARYGGYDSNRKSAYSSIVELVFSSSNDAWSVSKIIKEEVMKNKVEYSKLVFDRLKVREKEKLMMESIVPVTTEPGLTGGGEVELLKQQLVQKDQELKQMIMERKQIIQQKDAVIQQKDDVIQQKQQEVLDLQSQLESRPWVIQDEEVNVTNTIIGGGAYGEVRVAVFRGTRVAAKRLHELIVSRHNKELFTREMEISSGIHHPNIVQFIGATRINNPILLYELMPASLHKRLQDDESLTHAQIVSIGSDICIAMCYLHQWRPQPIIHRDISSPNVLMEPLPNDKWRAKLSDFGSANLQLHIKTVIPGNPAYAAPEALLPQHHSPAMDVYSFGVLLTEMTLHRAPEMDGTRRERRARSIDWVEMRVIVLECINNDRSQRLSSEQLLNELCKL